LAQKRAVMNHRSPKQPSSRLRETVIRTRVSANKRRSGIANERRGVKVVFPACDGCGKALDSFFKIGYPAPSSNLHKHERGPVKRPGAIPGACPESDGELRRREGGAMKTGLVFLMTGLGMLGISGCNVLTTGVHVLTYSTEECFEECAEQHRNRKWAEDAMRMQDPNETWSCDYAAGFKAGFAEFLWRGGNGEPPPLPPLKYRALSYQTAAGYHAIEEWFDGYREGAKAAYEGGYRDLVTGPSALKNTAPIDGPMPPLAAVEPRKAPVVPFAPPAKPEEGPSLPLQLPPAKVVPPEIKKTQKPSEEKLPLEFLRVSGESKPAEREEGPTLPPLLPPLPTIAPPEIKKPETQSEGGGLPLDLLRLSGESKPGDDEPK
jgi:hypothetical protein